MPIESRSSKLLIEGDHNVVKQFPMFGAGEPLYWWSERGLVMWEDARTNGYGTMTWQECAFRVSAISDMITNSSEDGDYADERIAMQRFVCSMERVIRQAKETGGPLDKGAAQEHARRRAKSVSMANTRRIDNVVAGDDPYLF